MRKAVTLEGRHLEPLSLQLPSMLPNPLCSTCLRHLPSHVVLTSWSCLVACWSFHTLKPKPYPEEGLWGGGRAVSAGAGGRGPASSRAGLQAKTTLIVAMCDEDMAQKGQDIANKAMPHFTLPPDTRTNGVNTFSPLPPRARPPEHSSRSDPRAGDSCGHAVMPRPWLPRPRRDPPPGAQLPKSTYFPSCRKP